MPTLNKKVLNSILQLYNLSKILHRISIRRVWESVRSVRRTEAAYFAAFAFSYRERLEDVTSGKRSDRYESESGESFSPWHRPWSQDRPWTPVKGKFKVVRGRYADNIRFSYHLLSIYSQMLRGKKKTILVILLENIIRRQFSRYASKINSVRCLQLNR